MIEFDDVHRTFPLSARQRNELGTGKEEPALHVAAGVSCCRKRGQLVTLLVPDGAGKTTALRLVATLMHPSADPIIAVGMDAARHPREVRRRIGFLSCTTRLCARPTPDELVGYYTAPQGTDRV